MAYQNDDDVKSLSHDILMAADKFKSAMKGDGKSMSGDIKELIKELNKSQTDLVNTGNIKDAAKKISEIREAAELLSKTYGYSNDKLNMTIKFMDDILESLKEINKSAVELGMAVAEPFEKLFKFLTKSKIINAIMPPDFKDRLDGIRKSFIGSLTSLAEAGQLNLRNFTTEIGTMINGYIKLFGTFITSILTNPAMLALAVTIGLIYAAFKLFTRMQDAAAKFRKDSGLAADQSKKMENSALHIASSSGEYGLNLEKVQDAQTAMIKSYSVISKVSEDLVTTSSFLAENWGLSNDESAELLRNMKANGDATDKMVIGLTSATIELSNAAGVAPTAVLKDMATNSETINKYFRGNNKLAILQTVQLHKMGLELKDMARITDGLLDFDSSIEKEMYASVLLNKQLDLSNARMKAFEGKTSEAVEDMLNQVGNFSQLNSIQKKGVSEALGMSEDQITKSIELLNVEKKMTAAQRKEYDLAKEKLAKTKEMTVESLLSDTNRMTQMQQFSSAWDKLLINISAILLPLFNMLSPVISGIAWVFSKIGDIMNATNEFLAKIPGGGVIGAILGGLAGFALLKVLSAGIVSIFKNLFGGIVEIVGKSFKAIGTGIGEAISSLSNSVKSLNVGSMIKGAFAIAILAGSIWLIGNALQSFANVQWGTMFLAVTAIVLLTGAILLLGAVMSSGVGAVAIFAGVLALAAMGGALLVVGIGLQSIVTAITTNGLIENLVILGLISPLLFVAAGGILMLSYALMAFAGTSVLGAIAEFFTGNPFQKFIDFASVAPQLSLAATSLNIMQTALENLNNVDISNFSKIADGLKSITNSLPDNTSFSIMGGVSTQLSAINNSSSSNNGSTDGATTNKDILQKLDTLIGMLKNGFGVYLDGKKVGEQLNKSKSNGNVC